MGFFQDLKQDLSQTVADINSDEVLDDMELDADMSASSEDLFGSVSGEDFADVEAMLEQEIPALNEEPMAALDEGASEDLLGSLGELENTGADVASNEQEAALELDAPMAVEDTADMLTADADAGISIPDSDISGIDVPVAEEEQKNSEISEADAEMEELLNEVEQNIEESVYMEGAPQEAQQPEMETSASASTDTAVITSGMTITGDVTSSGNMDLIGNITGNIEILGKLNVTGGITGNSSAAEIYAESAQINGEIRSKGSVKIGQSSVVIGNIFATSAVIAGAVKGDIDVHGPVILDTSAIVMGNIKSKSVQINNGAVIEGMCSQCYADVSPTSFFNDMKKNRKQS